MHMRISLYGVFTSSLKEPRLVKWQLLCPCFIVAHKVECVCVTYNRVITAYTTMSYYPNMPLISAGLDQLNTLRTSYRDGGPDLEMAHTYSQWQACLYATYILNRLLCLALPEPEKARLYCGPLVHQAALRLRSGMTPESLLSAGPVPLQLFRDLQDAVLDCLEPDVRDRLQKASRQNNPRDRRRTKSHSSIDDLASHFQHFEVDEEEEEEDDRGRGRWSKTDDEDGQLYGAACQIRTRHKKK
ncbi:protein asteroid homolog 1-like isoform X1 [Engraulis encrasicolus]|uniref:protein asteroid homolog 1-like isoform X1 n=1 Tax=Engraulis encrasicolus TaxID=184585 RepID=UPI002FD5B28B